MPKLIHGDAFEVLRTLEKGSVNLLLTDPPYGISKPSNRGSMNRQGTDFGEWDVVNHNWIQLVVPLLAPGANVVVFHDVWELGNVKEHFEAHGAVVRRPLAWLKTNPNPGNRDRSFTQTTEHAVWATMPGASWTFNRGTSYETGVFTASVPRNKVRVRHPTQKPVRLMRDIMKILSNPGDLVLDPFGGVGTTAAAAHELDRRWITIERDPTYYSEAHERLCRMGALTDVAYELFA